MVAVTVATRMGRLVALRLPPGGAFVAALEAAWAAGDAVLPLTADLPHAELERLVAEFRPAAIVDVHGETAVGGGAPVADGTALVVATSGSTGRAKGVELSHAALEASARASLARLGAASGQRWLCCLPLTHVAGLQVLVRARLLDTAATIHARFDPAAIAAEPDVAFVSLVPTMLARLLDAGVDVARFHALLLGGAPALPALLERAAATGARVVETYGMTETAGGCVYDGVPLTGVDVHVGEDGRIGLRGPVLFSGYRCRPDLDAAALRDGWFLTSDLGWWSADGHLIVAGRADDVIVTGGENVDPTEVEALLAEHPLVREVAVTGRPDPEWGSRVVAVCVPSDPRQPPDLDELRRFVSARAAAYKAPRELVLVEALPRTPLGKVARRQLLR
jgi:O-succinylbenzoic acid--CoA ligase